MSQHPPLWLKYIHFSCTAGLFDLTVRTGHWGAALFNLAAGLILVSAWSYIERNAI